MIADARNSNSVMKNGDRREMEPLTNEFRNTPYQRAIRQLDDYDARRPGTIFSEGITLDVAQGYELQSAVVQLRRERGERVIGYKVGCTSPTIRAQLGIDHCVTGRLFDTEQHRSNVTLSRNDFASLAIEGELAVELSREPVEADFLDNRIPPCVDRIFPVIELHHHVMRGQQPSAGELIANNAIHGGFVAGPGISLAAAADESLDSPSLSIYSDNELLDQYHGADLISTIHSSLRWLTQIVRDRSERLESGTVVLTGSIPSLIPIVENCTIRVDAPPFGCVEVTLST